MARAAGWLLAALAIAAAAPSRGQLQIDINRPRSPFECDTPVGESWYGSTQRCLDELCGGRNVTNEWLFDEHKRRRRNPCYGRDPTSFTGK